MIFPNKNGPLPRPPELPARCVPDARSFLFSNFHFLCSIFLLALAACSAVNTHTLSRRFHYRWSVK